MLCIIGWFYFDIFYLVSKNLPTHKSDWNIYIPSSYRAMYHMNEVELGTRFNFPCCTYMLCLCSSVCLLRQLLNTFFCDVIKERWLSPFLWGLIITGHSMQSCLYTRAEWHPGKTTGICGLWIVSPLRSSLFSWRPPRPNRPKRYCDTPSSLI